MTDDRLRSYGVFLLRVALGAMFVAHCTIYMLMTLTLAGTAKFFVSIGLPAWLAYANNRHGRPIGRFGSVRRTSFRRR